MFHKRETLPLPMYQISVKLLNMVLQTDTDTIKKEILEYCTDHIENFECMPMDMAFNLDEENEFIIAFSDFDKYLTEQDYQTLNNLIEQN